MAVVVVAANGTDDQAAAAIACDNARPTAEPVDVDPRLLMAARCGNSELLKNLLLLLKMDVDDVEAGSASLLSRVTMEGDTLLHVVAACGDADGDHKFLDCVNVIVRNMEKKDGAAAVRLALKARNNKGDTPLHCAAGAGNANMISCLIDLIIANNGDDDEDASQLKKGFVSMQSDCGETALHHAVRAPHTNEACIDKLMEHDPDLACVLHKDGTSPLYLAISLGKVEIAKHLYVKSKEGKLSYSGPHGRNVLHAAVPRGQALHMILRWLINDVKPREDGPTTTAVSTHGVSSAGSHQARPTDPERVTRGSSVPVAAADYCLLTQLSSQRDKKQKGSTPLHLAASLEGWPDARFLYTRSPPIKLVSISATEELLRANKSTAYQADDEGWYPIHVAAHAGSLGVVKMLLERCPNCATLRDGQGRTFLHVAAEKSRYDVVRYVVWEGLPHPLSRMMILNEQDSNGETALHCAVRAGNLAVFNCMFRNRQVRLDVANQDGMTPLDLSLTMIPAGFNYGLNPRNIVCSSLLAAGAPHGGDRPELFSEKHLPKRDLDEESKKHTEATQVMGVVTALVATVTFASAFTLPGGYRAAADGGGAAGTPVLAGRFAFDAFVLADTLAFVCSISATYTLVYAGLPAMDIALRNWYLNLSAYLLQSAARSLACAIALGLYLVLTPVDRTTAVAVCVIIFATSLYGNMGPWRIIHMASMVLARIGSLRRPPAALLIIWARTVFLSVFVHFGSYVIIFGLPAIRRCLIPAISTSTGSIKSNSELISGQGNN